MNKSMFILGASGFVGRKLVQAAVSDGWAVKALARSQSTGDQLAALGATPIAGDAESPEVWIAEAKNSRVMVDLIQPEIPRRVTFAAIQKISAQRLAFTRKLTAALQQVSTAERPLLLSISGTDDLEPDANGRIDGSSQLRR